MDRAHCFRDRSLRRIDILNVFNWVKWFIAIQCLLSDMIISLSPNDMNDQSFNLSNYYVLRKYSYRFMHFNFPSFSLNYPIFTTFKNDFSTFFFFEPWLLYEYQRFSFHISLPNRLLSILQFLILQFIMIHLLRCGIFSSSNCFFIVNFTGILPRYMAFLRRSNKRLVKVSILGRICCTDIYIPGCSRTKL